MSERVPDPRDESGPDLIERLRKLAYALTAPGDPIGQNTFGEAADELTALRSQVSELRADLEVAVDRSWEILKQRCCADPKKAKRCVMVSKDDFRAALLKDPDAQS